MSNDILKWIRLALSATFCMILFVNPLLSQYLRPPTKNELKFYIDPLLRDKKTLKGVPLDFTMRFRMLDGVILNVPFRYQLEYFGRISSPEDLKNPLDAPRGIFFSFWMPNMQPRLLYESHGAAREYLVAVRGIKTSCGDDACAKKMINNIKSSGMQKYRDGGFDIYSDRISKMYIVENNHYSFIFHCSSVVCSGHADHNDGLNYFLFFKRNNYDDWISVIDSIDKLVRPWISNQQVK